MLPVLRGGKARVRSAVVTSTRHFPFFCRRPFSGKNWRQDPLQSDDRQRSGLELPVWSLLLDDHRREKLSPPVAIGSMAPTDYPQPGLQSASGRLLFHLAQSLYAASRAVQSRGRCLAADEVAVAGEL